MSKLLPCPFCGSEAETLISESMHGGYLFGIICNDCRSRGDVYDTEAEAIDAWNSRAKPSCESGAEPENEDSREQLEADIRDYYRIGLSGIQEKEINRIYYNQILEWLDRQAAITDAEWYKELELNSRAERTCHIEWRDNSYDTDAGYEPDGAYFCTACRAELPYPLQECWDDYQAGNCEKPFNYCPNCGAKVRNE